jgi:hypothetical protein
LKPPYLSCNEHAALKRPLPVRFDSETARAEYHARTRMGSD